MEIEHFQTPSAIALSGIDSGPTVTNTPWISQFHSFKWARLGYRDCLCSLLWGGKKNLSASSSLPQFFSFGVLAPASTSASPLSFALCFTVVIARF
ncbi:hypothetical protein K1719_034286 [Acacia pycnantha]|nr:hypothetical protein K1719_034286 [Acacia pycnantha]